ncbi:HRDC domain-containing protein [Gordonia sp. Z-3]|uniref:HRDC domain-containing protein n=1 Tax=unclassified Gordonia (in: high G+C Gram-positive bacteria) TaxID=2657482 RepID=UPI000C43DF41|nr:MULTISPECIES: HRDC domain-containing protein [unclassified Gordonia (in: high G+C Gram-positive bacteria)]MAU82837.1 ribonuclease D [Gordonia sp. (in: high G+C Gram-positive bacteria)]MED5800245.1 HRDC domain-containing protein [Gordonia sp. Z-3]
MTSGDETTGPSDPTPPEAVTEPLLRPAEGVPPVLTSAAEFAAAAESIAAAHGPIAVDTERASGYRYSQRAYLIQIRRTGAGTFLLDPIEEPAALAPVIEALDGPEWVLHAADQDLPCLREVGFVCRELYDTELAGRLLGLSKVNLAAMVAEFLGLGLVKGHGAADWSRRPLPADWLNYAALDVEVLVELRDAMDAALAAAGKDQWAREEFRFVLERPPAPPRPDRWRKTSNIHTIKNVRTLAAIRELWTAREELAQRRDVAPGRVLPDSAIVTAATANPTSQAELTRLPVFGGPRQRRQAHIWLRALDRARELADADLPPRRSPTTGLPPINRWDQRNPDAAARAARVRPVIREIAEAHQVPTENLLAPEVVRQLCWEGVPLPATAASVAARQADEGARRWQRDLTAAAIAEALNSVDVEPSATNQTPDAERRD